ncbi:MFS transporter [Ligilactobacillus pobuzihii]|uniref:MFS transporter n=1 Tax=Ligilactobacillus pobuzihii TaxID=449659 RepID=UPI0019CF713A|nr:MFS transporter [Ligilactobacillus pobuzihii]MBN7274877.1 MFS transporter [Ligilactobacillus pobuzihii]
MVEQGVSRQTKLSITAAAMLSFLGILVETSLNVAFPTLTKEFNVTLGTMQWVTSGYLLMVTIIMSTTGFLTKKFNTRSLFTVAIIFNLLGTLMCATAQIFPVLLAGRLLQAVATGISTPVMYHLVMSLVPQSKLGTYMGIAAMIISLAPALGPTYGGTMDAFWSWRGIFIVVLPLLLLTAWIGEKNIRLTARGTNEKFDWVGVVLLSLTFFALSTAFANDGNYGFSGGHFGWMLGAFALGVALLALHFHFSKRQILNFKLLLKPLISLRWLNFFILQFINIGISFVIPIFAENYFGSSAFVAGLILLPGALVGAAVSPFAGRLYDKHGAFLPLMIASVALVVGTSLYFTLTPVLGVMSTTLIYIFLRGGFNFGFSNSMSDASTQVPPEQKADINSLFNTFQQYAGSFGTSVLSAVISAQQMKSDNSLAILTAQGSHIDYGILLILALVSLGTVFLAQHLLTRNN